MTRALLLVPPLVKYTAGPLLGPAMLAGAGVEAGHDVEVLDLSIRWLRDFGDVGLWTAPTGPFVGDHDRPRELLRAAQATFSAQLADTIGPIHSRGLEEDPYLTLLLDHAEVDAAVDALLEQSPLGVWLGDQLGQVERPDLVGVSVLYSGQMLSALVVSALVRHLWDVPVVWGGPHVTALRDQLPHDPLYGTHVDGFVCGYAEQTFVDLLDAIETGAGWSTVVTRAGSGRQEVARWGSSAPRFGDLHLHGRGRITLPAQLVRGCAYGRCACCTYSSIEGRIQRLPLESLRVTFEQARRLEGAVSLKDSLVLPRDLQVVAEIASGVPWSACSKLHPHLARTGFLQGLFESGCRTLELGVETLSPEAQRLIQKVQSPQLLKAVLEAAARAGLPLVLNYITGFPGQDAEVEATFLAELHALVGSLAPELTARFEVNKFQLERESAMGKAPTRFGIRVTRAWPWATVLAWEQAPVLVTGPAAATGLSSRVRGAA
jgi:hypothetical protein